jgi:hypothetical protein
MTSMRVASISAGVPSSLGGRRAGALRDAEDPPISKPTNFVRS